MAVTSRSVRTRRAFSIMLSVKHALTTGMLTYGEGRFTILESSEDRAAEVIEHAIKLAERRGVTAGRHLPPRGWKRGRRNWT